MGLAVEPNSSRNLNLYARCGFEATLPSCFVYRKLDPGRPRTAPDSIRTAGELGAPAAAAIGEIRGWTDEILPGLDFTRDLEHFARTYPERLWFHRQGGAVRGFLAYHQLFRGDAWGAVRPGAGDVEALEALVAAVEAAVPDEALWFHFHTGFRRLLMIFWNRGYRIVGHKTCMLLEGRAAGWPLESDALFLRPWWS